MSTNHEAEPQELERCFEEEKGTEFQPAEGDLNDKRELSEKLCAAGGTFPSNDRKLTSVLKLNDGLVSCGDVNNQGNKQRKKTSRVEFQVTIPEKGADDSENIDDDLPVGYSTRSRQSFSGRSSVESRIQRYSVGANYRPSKHLSREQFSPTSIEENGKPTDVPVQIFPENEIFVELDELELEKRMWRQTTRWMKYEERLLSNGDWSRPQIPFLEVEGFQAMKDYLHEGLIFLEFESDSLLDFSHTLATTITMCNPIEQRYRLRLQQILYLSVQHQGDTTKRLVLKEHYRQMREKDHADRRSEKIKRAFETSHNRVRNQWIQLSRKAVMFSKLSAECAGNSDDSDVDEAIINISSGQKAEYPRRTSKASKQSGNVLSVPVVPFHVILNLDHYPLTSNQEHLLKALSPDCDGVAVRYAPLDFLDEYQSFLVLVRFTSATKFCDFFEVPIKCKFVFLLCASPHGDKYKDLQVCRAFGCLMTDKIFQNDMLLARRKHDVIAAVDKYIKDSVLFPPGQWDLDYLKPSIEDISNLSSQRHFKRNQSINLTPRKRERSEHIDDDVTSVFSEAFGVLPVRRDTLAMADDVFACVEAYGTSPRYSRAYSVLLAKHPLRADGRWFGGVRREMARRYPFYSSDITDAFHIQCLAAFLFVLFGMIALAITFGNLLVNYTDGYMGDREMLIATSISCMLMALTGTEPHTVIGGTAAMVVIEAVVYKVYAAALMGSPYLTYRVWVGLWIAVLLLLILAFEKTYWISYCTRFTEEILHSMIAILFILEALKDIYKVFQHHPLRSSYSITPSMTEDNNSFTRPKGSTTEQQYGRPNTALLHTFILFSTFGIAVGLRLFQHTRYFSPLIRRLFNFFSIPLAVIAMYLVSRVLDVELNTIEIKHGFGLTSPENRTWFIDPNLSEQDGLGWGIAVLTVFPASFVVVVIFIETEITALMCYKETVPRKGTGFHVNLLIVAITVVFCSLFGLPWMCLAAVETNNHIDSLRVWTSHNIPGIKSHVEKVRQQRVTLFLVGLGVGLFLYQPYGYGHIPTAVLSGLTLYMGVVATFGVQFFKRVEMLFMAPSQHPYIEYLTNVPKIKVYLFTVIQIIIIVLLLVIKSVEQISFIFPILIILMIPTRVLLGKYVFTTEEMEQLDNEEDEE